MKSTKIAIVDDHKIVAQGLKMLIVPQYGKQHLQVFHNGKSLLEALSKQVFDLIILDIQLPDIMAFSLIPKILKEVPHQKIFVFSMYPEKIIAQMMFDLGAKGYLNKKADDSDILMAIKTVLNVERYMSDALKLFYTDKFLNKDHTINPLTTLSNRELEVMVLLLKGFGGLEIGNQLNLNSSTVATYKNRIFEKMAVTNIIELYNKGTILGLI